MTVPTYGRSVVDNYKRMFKEKYGRDTKIHDDVIWDIFNTVHNDDSIEACDSDRLDEMLNREKY